MNAVIRVVSVVAGVALVLFAWYQASDLVVWLMDKNLSIIKFVCGLIPAPYGSMAEVALRGALGADKALLFAEGSWLVGGLLHLFAGPSEDNQSVGR